MGKSRQHFVLLGTICLLWLGLLVSLAQEQTVFVQARNAQLRSGKTSMSPVVATLQSGEPLQVIRREGDWMEVRTGTGATGWLFANKVGTTKPSTGTGTLAALGSSFRQREASPVTASTGARGLDRVSEEYARQVGIPPQHRDAVDRMTVYRLSEQELEAFLREGRLGEYAQ